MNEAIEFHDATVREVREESGRCIIEMCDVTTHRSEGTPGVDAGVCFIQDFHVVVESARVKSVLPEMPCELDGGDLTVGSQSFSNVVPSALKEEKSTMLRLWVAWDRSALEVEGRSVAIVPTSEARFLQPFPPRT